MFTEKSIEDRKGVRALNKLALLLTVSAIAPTLSVALTLLKASLSDVTEISPQNMLSPQWVWSHKYFLLGVVAIAVPWLMANLYQAQLGKEFSSGTQTASISGLAFAIPSALIYFIQFFIFQLLRSERIPPFGLNRVWIDILLMAGLSFAVAYIGYDALLTLQPQT
jgi:hypothetical protein